MKHFSALSLAAAVAFLPTACHKKSSKHSDASTGAVTTGAGTLNLNFSAISAQGDFGESSRAANAAITTPGTLKLTYGLTGLFDQTKYLGGDLHLTDASTRTPILQSTSIGSGAPDEMTIYIKSITLNAKETSDNGGGGDGDDSSPVAMTDAIVASQFSDLSASIQSSLNGLDGKVYDTAEALLAAVMGITGETQDQTVARLEPKIDDLKKAGADAGGAVSSVVIFQNDDGAAVKLANGTVDLSALVANAQGSAAFSVTPGTFKNVTIKYASKAQVKGCVKMLYKCMSSGSDVKDCNAAATADVPGNGGSANPVLVNYCTRTDKSPYIAGTQNSDFQDKEAQAMDFPLDMPGSSWPQSGDLSISYNLGSAVTIAAGDSVDLTLAVDMNRLLRYYNRGRQDQGVNPGAPMDKSYFFSTIFSNSTYAFVGKPGRIYGYEMIARVCSPGATYDATSGHCSDSNAAPGVNIPFWVTLITSSEGSPLKMLTSPDDDNDLTIVKGTDRDASRCAIDATAATPTMPWVRVADGATVGSLHFAMCDNNNQDTPQKPGPYGEFDNFPVALDSPAVVDSSYAIELAPDFTNADVAAHYVPGLTIETHARQSATSTDNVYKGFIVAIRRL